MIGDWSYVALADGSVNGPGWSGHVEVKKGVCGPRCGEKLVIMLNPGQEDLKGEVDHHALSKHPEWNGKPETTLTLSDLSPVEEVGKCSLDAISKCK
jgi:hypothetical protein